MKTTFLYKIHSYNLKLIRLLKSKNILFLKNDFYDTGTIKESAHLSQLDDKDNIDFWIQGFETAQKKAKEYYEQSFPLREREKLKKLDLYRSYLEFEAKILEENQIFTDLVDTQKKPIQISKPFLAHPLFEKRFVSDIFTYADKIKHFLEAKKKLATKMSFLIVFLFGPKLKIQCYNGCIRGVTASEIPTNDISLNCFWMEDDKIIPENETFFYFCARDFKAKLQELNIRRPVFTLIELTQSLSFSQKFSILLKTTGLFFKNFFKFNMIDFFLADALYKSLIWKSFSLNTNLRWIATSISENWPSPAEFEVLHNFNIKTILWSYSLYGFRATTSKPFANKSLIMSLSNYSHILMWTPEISELHERDEIRVFDIDWKKQYHISNPILNGRMGHLKLNQKSALNKLGIEFNSQQIYISIFDLVACKKNYRLSRAIEPYMTDVCQDAFYENLVSILKEMPNLTFLFKPKRGIASNLHLPKLRQDIIDQKLEKDLLKRIIVLEESIDPFLVIKASHLVVTSFFTSPSAIAQNWGIPSAYFEPTHQYRYTASRELSHILLGDSNSIKEKIKLVEAKKDNEIIFNDYTEKLKKTFSSILN